METDLGVCDVQHCILVVILHGLRSTCTIPVQFLAGILEVVVFRIYGLKLGLTLVICELTEGWWVTGERSWVN